MSAAAEDDDAYDLAPCALATLTVDGRIERANRALCTWTNRTREALLGRPFADLLTIGSKLFHQTHWLPLMEMQGSLAEVQLELAGVDGAMLPVLVNAQLRADRRIDVALFVVTDRRRYERELLAARRRAEELLDALKQREAELRTVGESSPDIIARFDRDGRCTYMSRAVETLIERPVSDYLGKRSVELDVPVERAQAFARAFAQALAGNPTSYAIDFRRADGTMLDLETRVVPERDANGVVASVLVITRDVTALRAQEHEAKQRAVFAEQLIGIVSHDLRNPLNAIMLGAQLLGTSELGSDAGVVRRIVSAARRATRLTAELLDFTQARLGGGLPLSRAEVNPHLTVADCLEELRLAWPGRAIEHRRVGEGTAEIDIDRVAQIVTNLVGNALAYGTPERPIVVTTTVDADDFTLTVHNHGPPIPAELASHVFEPMRRGLDQVRHGSRSVGLGLFIVRQIALSHGGDVQMESSAEGGTRFSVVVPRRAST